LASCAAVGHGVETDEGEEHHTGRTEDAEMPP
jgi:hypothetical protein